IYWNPEKNDRLKKLRKVTFEDLLTSRFIGIENHPTKKHQKLMLFEHKKYVWVIPYVEGEDYLFLKTAFQNRKFTKKYLGR
ncbi:MAG: toxin, partial [Candidatus Omnitrophica bacterium]|nr:toxin [Candidatus Omnitrophota bacterium]